MAWILIDVDDNGRARWANDQNIQDQQYLPAGQDPNNPATMNPVGFTPVQRGSEFDSYTEKLAWTPEQAKNILAESAYGGLATGDRNAANAAVQAEINKNPSYWESVGLTDPNAISDYAQQLFWRRLTNQDDDKLADVLNNLAFLPHTMGLGNLLTGGGVDSLLSKYLGNPSVSFAEGGMPTQVGGWSGEGADLADWWAQDSSVLQEDWLNRYNAVSGGGTMMPPAVPETAEQLTEWGLREVSPGVWEQPAMPDIQMSAGDWLKYGGSLLKSALSGDSSAQTSLSKLFGGSGGESDLWSLLGKLAPSLLGMYASNQQSNKLSELAQKYQDFGAPYRQKLAEISADPNAFYNSEGAQKATDAVLRKLSIGGNPAGSANKQALTIDSLYDQYGKERDRLAGFGGLTNYNQAAPQLETQAIGANANMWNAAGAGLNDIFNPKPSLSELFKQMKTAGAF